jgi:hypothetical protein
MSSWLRSCKQFWPALNASPKTFNVLAAKLCAEPTHVFHEVFGSRDEFGLYTERLAMVPRPRVAVVFLFPTSGMRDAKAAQLARLEEEKYTGEDANGIFFVRQYVGKASGTIATILATRR